MHASDSKGIDQADQKPKIEDKGLGLETLAGVFLSPKPWCDEKNIERSGLYNLYLGKAADLENLLLT